MTQALDQRRYELDWLRTLAFMLLILYHIGMYYVADWDWHVKSAQQSVFLQDLMILTNQWRMSLLFFISAMALALVEGKFSNKKLLSIRSSRLLIPLLFGMFVIVPPQAYYEGLRHGLFEPGYWTYWLQYIDPNTDFLAEQHGPIGLLTWNHLWFLPYLWCYSMMILLAKPLLNRLAASAIMQKASGLLVFIVLIGSLTAIWFFLRQRFPVTHDLFADWYNHGKYFLVFVSGYLLVKLPDLWQKLVDFRLLFLGLAVAGYSLIVMDRHDFFPQLAAQYEASLWVKLGYGVIYITNHWAWIFAVVGYAGRYLTFSHPLLSYANQAILPWYILHQSLIVIFAVNLQSWHLAVEFEALVLTLLTLFGCIVGYEIVRRVSLLRLLFGLKIVTEKPQPQSRNCQVQG